MRKTLCTILFLLLLLNLASAAVDFEKLYQAQLDKAGKQVKPVLNNAAARYFLLKGNLEKAGTILKNNLNNFPDDPDSLFLTSLLMSKNREYAEAKLMCNRLLRQEPQNPRYLSLIIFLLEKTGDTELLAKYQSLFDQAQPQKKPEKEINSLLKVASATSLIKNSQKLKLKKMKEEMKNIYFTTSKLPVEKQEEIAEKHYKKIQELSTVKSFDSVDHVKVYEEMREVLKNAPDSKLAQIVHWKSHFYHLGLLDNAGTMDWGEIQVSLESYLAKYPEDETHKDEAYDKLCLACEKNQDYETMIYYADLYLERNPAAPTMLLNKATALLALGEMERGVELLEKIVEEKPYTVQYNLAFNKLEELGY